MIAHHLLHPCSCGGVLHRQRGGVAKVQSWINTPSSNYGFIIQDYVNNANGLDFSSSEFATVSSRPKLTVTYQ